MSISTTKGAFKMNSYKFFRLTVIFTAFLFVGIVSRGDALTITGMSGSAEEYDWGSGATHSATVTTDSRIMSWNGT